MNKNSVDLLLDVIERFPGSKLKPLAVAMHYLSENVEGDVVGYLKMLEFVLENGLHFVEEELRVKKTLALLEDDGGAPANSVTGVQPTDEPVIDGATKKNKKNMDTRKAYGDLFTRSKSAAV